MLKWRSAPILLAFAAILIGCGGCQLFPDVRHRPRFHNPFPQLKRVAILPFYNQSDEPTLDVDLVTDAYFGELQAIPGFEVLPVAVVQNQWRGFIAHKAGNGEIAISGEKFQEFARQLDVDALVVGAVTDYSPYYPPRMALAVHWYAANPGYHPIPPGYGLPWGTRGEDKIPGWVVQETEAEVARQQLETQSPSAPSDIAQASGPPEPIEAGDGFDGTMSETGSGLNAYTPPAMPTPEGWPDPSGLIPDGPSPTRPPLRIQHDPVLSHTRMYQGTDIEFTERLAAYYEVRDDARFGGWQNYLGRSEDFVRFCCYVHLTDMLELRGGRDKSDLILRWPLNRYTR